MLQKVEDTNTLLFLLAVKRSIIVKSTIRWTTERKSDSGALENQALSNRSQKRVAFTLLGKWRQSRGTSGRREDEGE